MDSERECHGAQISRTNVGAEVPSFQRPDSNTFLQGGGHLNMEQEARMGSGVPLPTGNCAEP